MKAINYLIITAAVALATLTGGTADAQKLAPGFDIDEYIEVLRMNSHFKISDLDSIYLTEKPKHSQRLYSSPVVGFDNAWEMWQMPDDIICICVRGSVTTTTSWTSNFHAGMVPATGTLQFGKTFNYDLCADSTATVHVGWLGGLSAIADDVVAHIDSCYKAGRRDFILSGHSQGGAICYLLTAYLYRMREKGDIPADINFKTYCSAAPKPGNAPFAFSYEYMTRGGRSFNVVNADDWVPETPLSIQTLADFRPTNPFENMMELLDKLDTKRTDKMKIKILFSTLDKSTKKTEAKIRKYLGSAIGNELKKSVPEYTVPELTECANYMRVGATIVLMPNAEYHSRHPQKSADAFEHHMYKAYGELAEIYKRDAQ